MANNFGENSSPEFAHKSIKMEKFKINELTSTFSKKKNEKVWQLQHFIGYILLGKSKKICIILN